ncbi:variable large family protein (plasmid) [Borrelia coriaceae]|uniref:Variable large protein n=1 Tax=Borrelia coriaceae ATCC 43381 TaxID=1408429 RepID=W5SX08_9SPIR|nr:variable large family protein [Borrelia coriaceae]AHH11435.1 Variable outer membrane protein [Borrelia coriaceae ATCC 43381]UPA17409.1 variable large family protein [Borrelia coriaceae]
MKINIKNIKVKSICVTLFISLLLSCNNGIEELEKRNQFLSSLANLGNDFLTVFTSFGEMTGTVLGFNKETKKSEVGDYFKKVQDTVQIIKDKLNKIVDNMRAANNPNATSVETEVNKLVSEKLDNIIGGAKTASEAIDNASELLGNIASKGAGGNAAHGAGAQSESVESLVKGIKEIVGIALKDKGNAEAGTDTKAEDGGQRTSDNPGNGEATKLFVGAGNAGDADQTKKSATDAAKAVGAVIGTDILKAIVKDGGDAAKLAKNNAASVNTTGRAKDATIAGAIALRAMAKNGKFANASAENNGAVAAEIKGTAVSAVTKALNTLTIAIRKTIDTGLQEVKKAMNINADDTPVTTETKN